MLGPQLDPKTERVAQLPCFATCSLRELGRIAAVGTELDLAARRPLQSGGARRGQLIVVSEGSVELVESGRAVLQLGPGGVIGPSPADAAPDTFVRVGPWGASVLVFTVAELAALTRDIATFAARVAAAPGIVVSSRGSYRCTPKCAAHASTRPTLR